MRTFAGPYDLSVGITQMLNTEVSEPLFIMYCCHALLATFFRLLVNLGTGALTDSQVEI